MVLLETSLEQRVDSTHEEYVIKAQQQWGQQVGEEDGLESWYRDIGKSLGRIRKRLGGVRFKHTIDCLDRGFRHQLDTGDAGLHRLWVEVLLSQYYDPMYDYQIKKSGRKILFQGCFSEVLEFFRAQVC